jgi:hypothetical protein
MVEARSIFAEKSCRWASKTSRDPDGSPGPGGKAGRSASGLGPPAERGRRVQFGEPGRALGRLGSESGRRQQPLRIFRLDSAERSASGQRRDRHEREDQNAPHSRTAVSLEGSLGLGGADSSGESVASGSLPAGVSVARMPITTVCERDGRLYHGDPGEHRRDQHRQQSERDD